MVFGRSGGTDIPDRALPRFRSLVTLCRRRGGTACSHRLPVRRKTVARALSDNSPVYRPPGTCGFTTSLMLLLRVCGAKTAVIVFRRGMTTAAQRSTPAAMVLTKDVASAPCGGRSDRALCAATSGRGAGRYIAG